MFIRIAILREIIVDELGIIDKLNIKTKDLKIVNGTGNPRALAIDWITNNIYFYDKSLNMIKVNFLS